MYGLPKDLSLEFLLGQTLLQVCIGVNDLILNFDNDVSMTVTSRVGCFGFNSTEHQYNDFRKAAQGLMIFLNQTIEKAEGSEGGRLRLAFNKGDALIIYDDSLEYESYTIRHGERVIVI